MPRLDAFRTPEGMIRVELDDDWAVIPPALARRLMSDEWLRSRIRFLLHATITRQSSEQGQVSPRSTSE